MSRCSTCLYKDVCVDCVGYVEDEKTASARAEYEELCADVEREEGSEDTSK